MGTFSRHVGRILCLLALCFGAACFQLVPFTIARKCQLHADCGTGQLCAAGLCVKAGQGSEHLPVLSKVSALGANGRLDARARLRLEGVNLGGTQAVNLRAPSGALLTRLDLESVGAAIVDAIIPAAAAATLPPGPVVVELLTANATATRDVDLLQGEAGPPGATGATGTTGATGADGANPVLSVVPPLQLSAGVLSIAPRVDYYRVSAMEFWPVENDRKHWGYNGGVLGDIAMHRGQPGEALRMNAPLHLPHAAFINSVTCTLYDDLNVAHLEQIRVALMIHTGNSGLTCGAALGNTCATQYCDLTIPLPVLGDPDYVRCRNVNNRPQLANPNYNHHYLQVTLVDTNGVILPDNPPVYLSPSTDFRFCVVDYTR
ncbi:MAG: hypothetical protein IT381_25280 [Deltaproteobacteria bacterium]|nr:hypothetical protein [Deltaproteobacteria bacterium]